MKDKAISLGEYFKKCIEFHDHMCPGLAIGFQAAFSTLPVVRK
jgi:formylmethanofuran dehydrogenase subunit E